MASNSTFVQKLYQTILARDPDVPGSAYWTKQLDTGVLSQPQVAYYLFSSPEYQQGVEVIGRLYDAAFLRMPDLPGLQYWMSILRQGANLDFIATQFVTSPEFVGSNPFSGNGALVDIFYRNVLSRTADPDGRAYWVAKLDGGASSGAVLREFAQSPEFQAKANLPVTNTIAYYALAGRAPTNAELSATPGNLLDIVFGALLQAPAAPISLVYNLHTFSESLANDGSIGNTVTITLSGDTFKAGVGSSIGTISGVPSGLKATLVETTPTTALLTLTGVAAAHASTNSTNLTVAFKDSDFSTLKAAAISGASKTLAVDFVDFSATNSGGILSELGTLSGTLDFNLKTGVQSLNGLTTTHGYKDGILTTIAPGDLNRLGCWGLDASSLGGKITISFTGKDGQSNSFFANNNKSTALGGNCDDTLLGGNGNDTLNGLGGKDTLNGGAGDDTLTGGSGDNTMTGGPGKDLFVLAPPSYVPGITTKYFVGLQSISDFEAGGVDTLKLTPLLQKPTIVKTVYTANGWDAAHAPMPCYQVKNGNVVFVENNLTWLGVPTVPNAMDVAALFSGTQSTAAVAGTPFLKPLSTFEAVVVTADLLNGADVWYIHNDVSDTTIDHGISTINHESEVMQIAHLSGNWNLLLTGVTAIPIV